MKRPQKLNLLNLRTETFSAVKMKLFELEIIFQFETRELRKMVGNHFTTQEKLRIIVIVVNNDQDSLFLLQIISHVSTAFRGQPLQTPSSSPKLNLLCKKRTQGKTLKETVHVWAKPKWWKLTFNDYKCRKQF